jgi:hypothetical protein
MHATVIKGRVDRIFFHPVERTLYLMLEGATSVHQLRTSDESEFKSSLLLTKPGDEIVIHERGGRIDKWSNITMSGHPG